MVSRTLPKFLLLFFLLSFTSCKQHESQRLEKEVLRLHDEVMPLLGGMKSKEER